MNSNKFPLVILMLSVLLSSGCISTEEDTGEGVSDFIKPSADIIPVQKPEHLFAEDSFWNQPLPADSQIDVKSEVMMNVMKYVVEENGFLISTKEWTIPVYVADENTPRYDVPLVIDWTPAENMVMINVPIPEFAREDSAVGDISEIDPFVSFEEVQLGDGTLVIVDTTTAPWTEYDFWQARQVDEKGRRMLTDDDRKGAKWIASWINKISLGSDGIFPCGLSATGSGNALLGGLIWPEELVNGKINHKISFSFSYNHDGGPIPPFTENDGWISESKMNKEYKKLTGSAEIVFPLPEGAIIQLDPTIDLDLFEVTDYDTGEKRNLKSYEKTIAKAMQEYGMVNVDNGGAIQLYAVSYLSYPANPYDGVLPDDIYVYFPKEIIEYSRVIRMDSIIADPDTGLTRQQWDYYLCDGGQCIPDWICDSEHE